MKQKLFKNWGIFAILLVILIFNLPVFLKGLIPVPGDAMVGLYHPYRDYYAVSNPNGIAFKNFLLTDPVRQLIVWKDISIDIAHNGVIPLWNPYEMAGKPMLGNFQSSVFYPLNILFIWIDFKIAWTIYIILSQVMGGIFMYLFLGSIKKSESAKMLGGIAFVFSGFFISWFEWGNVGHAYIWLPLGLYVSQKIASLYKKITNKRLVILGSVLGAIFSLSFFAGHPQTTFYILIFITGYLFFALDFPVKKKFLYYATSLITFLILSSIQIIQGLVFISNSMRGEDQLYDKIPGWFLPYQNVLQFISPDYFGNPATLNYWGVFNYGEFVGYVGVPLLILGIVSLLGKKDRVYKLSILSIVICLLFLTENPISKIPYQLSIPILSNMQPTRLMGIVSFCMILIGLYGYEYWRNSIKMKRLIIPLAAAALLILIIWILVFLNIFSVDPANLAVTKRNIILPTLISLASIVLIIGYVVIASPRKMHIARAVVIGLFFLLVIFDLLRFANKFTPFSDASFFYPSTTTISFLQGTIGSSRMMSVDDRILAPNITTFYKLQNISGYDPLYLRNFAELIVASERGRANTELPFGFNRIISPKNYESKIVDLLGVKYVLSLNTISSEKLNEVHREGATIVYENTNVFDRAFFVPEIVIEKDKAGVLKKMFETDLKKMAVVASSELDVSDIPGLSVGVVTDFSIQNGNTIITTSNTGEGFLIVSDVYYPLIEAFIDGESVTVYEADYAMRGVFVPKGKHTVEFKVRMY